MSKNQYRNQSMNNGKKKVGGHSGRFDEQKKQMKQHDQNGHRGYPHPEGEKERTKAQIEPDQILEQLEKQIDEDAAFIGIVIVDIFKTLAKAHGALPSMDLKTDLFHIVVNEACISVDVFDPDCVGCPGFPDCCDEEYDGFDEFDGQGSEES